MADRPACLFSRPFDPIGRIERLLSPKGASRALRACLVVAFGVLLIHRASEYRTYSWKPLWVVETLVFVVFVVSYAVRSDPVERSRGVREIVVPLIGAALPFTLLLAPVPSWMARDAAILRIVFSWMTASTAFTLWGLWTLRRSFSITVEARGLVTGGPYAWVRHPVYAGEIAAAAGVAAWRLSAVNILIFLAFVVVQLVRSRTEEEKLTRVLPGYGAYLRRARWFW